MAGGWRVAALAGAIALATAGVVVGTVVGNRLLARMPERTFRPMVAALVGALGAYMIVRGIGGS